MMIHHASTSSVAWEQWNLSMTPHVTVHDKPDSRHSHCWSHDATRWAITRPTAIDSSRQPSKNTLAISARFLQGAISRLKVSFTMEALSPNYYGAVPYEFRRASSVREGIEC
ncbi:hypothetical protein HAX54_021853 [Datura stramonium]|uniref:Uncharacterized protein n=1 Tax=Datura stramonium TaxID=4076 RepID=A0ABS8UV96_DATST|nr:hypothetical protein [Datura stramonium]